MSLSRPTPNLRAPAVAPVATDEQPILMRSSRTAPAELRQHSALPRRIGMIGNHLPRQCGIATFTTDLCDAIEGEFPSARILAVPVTDAESSYKYPARVQFELEEADVQSYERAKNLLQHRHADVVCLQHEYGIFGGPAGSHILQLLRGLDVPLVTTLHTVLREPNSDQRFVMEEIANLSSRLIVMSEHSSRLLQDVFKVPVEKIDLIQHGVPNLPFLDSTPFKKDLGVEGKTILLSFGLLSPNKGIENIIKALPEILLRDPDVVLLIVGATHPHLMRREGDRYRRELETLAEQLGVAASVRFHHQFVSPADMAHFIKAADIYITPYKHVAQVTSGTLAYAIGAGKAIISTPYWHAAELLADGRGVLVPFEDPKALGERTIELLENPALRLSLRKRAYSFGRRMIWEQVAREYMRSFQKACDGRAASTCRGLTLVPRAAALGTPA
jgi:glycosyltransferase involved in cell wall biosynthesis